MPSEEGERSIYEAAKQGLTSWLGRAREAVMAPWKKFRAQPNPEAIPATVPIWQKEVDRILAALTPALREGWAAANLPGDFDPKDPFIRANIAMTENLLMRIPDEVHAMVVKEIFEGTKAGETLEQIAQRVDNVLTFTGSENWNGRAQLIGQTESTRHYSSSMLAHALQRQQAGRRGLMKRWDTRMDGKERDWHKEANDQMRELAKPFDVGGQPLLFPGDPISVPANVCNCRCVLQILEGAR